MIERALRLHQTCMMKENFQRVIWPLIFTASLFGFALIEYPQGKPRRLLSLFYATVMIGLQVALYVLKEIWFVFPDPIFIPWIGQFITTSCYLISLISICLTHWHGKRYDRCLGAIDEIDDTLRNLGIKTNHSKLRRAVVIGLITWTTWCCLLNTSDTILFAVDGRGLEFSIIFPFLFDTPFHVPILIDMHFWCVVGYAGTKFDCIDSALRKLVFGDNDCVGWFRNDWMTPDPAVFVLDEKSKRTIWTMMHLHFELCQTLRNMHRVFEAQISLQMNFCCVFIISCAIFTFRLLLLPFEGDKFEMIVVIWIWAVPFFIIIVVTNKICESVSAKATSVGDTAVELLGFMDDKEMCENISLVLLQTKQHPMRFSNLGKCEFGDRYMCETFNLIVTMLVIILQLKTGFRT